MIVPGKAIPLTDEGLRAAANFCQVSREELWAVVQVETSGCGFLSDRRPVILFERHVFFRKTGVYSDISDPTPGGYGAPGRHQYDRLNRALEIDPIAALESASWGLGQIMGDNHKRVGYSSAAAMVNAFRDGEDAQLMAIAAFMRNSNLCKSLRAHDWQSVARTYNGPGYARNSYDTRLKRAYSLIERRGLPNLQLRARQIAFMFYGRYDGKIDGLIFLESDEE